MSGELHPIIIMTASQPHTSLSSARHYIPLIIWGIWTPLSLSFSLVLAETQPQFISQWFHFPRGSYCTLELWNMSLYLYLWNLLWKTNKALTSTYYSALENCLGGHCHFSPVTSYLILTLKKVLDRTYETLLLS